MSNVTINNHDLRINKATKIQAAVRGFNTRRKIVNDVFPQLHVTSFGSELQLL